MQPYFPAWNGVGRYIFDNYSVILRVWGLHSIHLCYQVALSSLQEPFKEGDDSRDGRALTILQLAGKAAEMSPYLKSQLLPNMAWMIKMFGHDFFQEVS